MAYILTRYTEGVLLTWGELPSTAIRQNNIVIDDSDSRPLVTVKICHYDGQVKYSSVKHDMGFAVSFVPFYWQQHTGRRT